MSSTRRNFLASAALAGAASPLSAASAARVVGANDRVRFALIGCGGMGRGDLRDFLRAGKTQVVGLCDVDPAQIGKAEQVVSEAGQKADFTTGDFRKVLERNDLDAVIVATPDHWHALPTVEACKAGKDVYVEKPLSVAVWEGRQMVDAARKHDRVVQMGTQQRSGEIYRNAKEYVDSGALGKVRLVRCWAYLDWKGETPKVPDSAPPPGVDYDMWLGPTPKRPFNANRFHFTFRWFWEYSGGLMTDWGAHMIDIANWYMGIKAPTSAMSVGGKFAYPDDAMVTPDTQQVLYEFPEFSMVWEHALGVGRGPFDREHGVALHGENGILVIDRGGWEVYPETQRIERPRTYKMSGRPREAVSGDMHLAHVENFLECMRSRKRPHSDVEIGHNSMIACHLGNAAVRTGRRVYWDVENEQVKDDKEAEAIMYKREYRKPWKLEA
ncbi:MAG: Gfo/Idh/MocA family oxidoreductase [Acidobacteria bacterium]|nr:Gfo/Idh/MocA family oxidoreductase [Acidobacteriota bacterium]